MATTEASTFTKPRLVLASVAYAHAKSAERELEELTKSLTKLATSHVELAEQVTVLQTSLTEISTKLYDEIKADLRGAAK